MIIPLTFNAIVWSFILGDIFCRKRWNTPIDSVIIHIFRRDFRQYLNLKKLKEGDKIYVRSEQGYLINTIVKDNWKAIEQLHLQEIGKEYPMGQRFEKYKYCLTQKDLTPAEQVLYGEKNEICKS